ncbi:DUF11 domain-containing protein [Candidatus Parcubacteria bacterium]|nr:DUF11 domain-containing protein [Candidatus Parcubacteria bacterium]
MKRILKTRREKFYKAINIISAGLLVINMSFLGVFFVASPKAQAQVAIEENPTLSSSCGIDIVLIMDSSSSMYGNPLKQEKAAFKDFVDAFLPNTPTQIAVVDFGTIGNVVQGYTNDVNDLKSAIDSATTTPNSTTHPDYVEGSRQYTNWHDALVKAHSLYSGRDKPKLYVFASDGNPNRYGDGSDHNSTKALNYAINQANIIKKQDGIRIITLGIGNSVDSVKLQSISGPIVAPPASIDENADVILTNFTDLAGALSNLADNLCAGTVTVRKYLDNVSDDDWTFYASTTAGHLNQTSGQTEDGGYVVFEINGLDGEIAEVNISEDLPSGYSLASAYCEGGLGTWTGLEIFGIPVSKNDSVYCEFYNIETPLPATSSISGFKFEDLDKDASTTKIVDEEWVISLFDVNASTTATTTTDSYGYYIFENLTAGIYEISEYLFGDWIQLLAPNPVNLGDDDSTDNNFVNYLPFCGNGIIDQEIGEQCDDGNDYDGDGCSSTCQTEGNGGEDSYCGDGIKNQESEECDGSDGVPSGYHCTAQCILEADSNGGGGGGSTPLSLRNEQVVCVSETEVEVTWLTNKYAAGRVVYGTESQISIGASPNYGYTYSTNASVDNLMSHFTNIAGLANNTYYFRPIANISPDTFGKEISFNMADCKVIVLGDEGAPVLTIVKTVSKEKANPGETDIEFVIIVKNEGNLTAFNVKLNDILPPGISFQDFDGNIKDWDFGDINPNEEAAVRYMVMVNDDAEAKVYANNASASADNHESITASADFEVEKVIVLAETGFRLSEFIMLFVSLLTLVGSAIFIRSRQSV